jgi:hypothetical protein
MVFERVANELRGGVSGLPPMELDEAVKLDSGGVLMYLGTSPQDQGEGRLVITTRFAAACKGASPIPNLAYETTGCGPDWLAGLIGIDPKSRCIPQEGSVAEQRGRIEGVHGGLSVNLPARDLPR